MQISIVIPAFNVEAYIHEAIASALAQKPPVHKVIVIDDGSTDGTRSVVSRFDDDRIVYKYQANAGLGPARNAGMDMVESGYVLFLDADDILVDGVTSYLFSSGAARGFQPELIVFSAVDFDDATGATCASSSYFRWPLEGSFERGRDFLLSTLVAGGGPACAFLYAFDVNIVRRGDPLRFLPIIHEDEAFTPALFARSGLTEVSNRVLYRRRIRPGSIMRSGFGLRNVVGLLAAAHWWRNAGLLGSPSRDRAVRWQVAKLYGRAILYAARAGLHSRDVLRAVEASLPEFARFVHTDILISRISRQLAQRIIRWRSRGRRP